MTIRDDGPLPDDAAARTGERPPAERARRKPGLSRPGRTLVLAYYFPQWHVDPRNEAMLGPGWTEWDVVRSATQRFPGHDQPRVPLWGETDESDPATAARIAATAGQYGVDGFIVDWYWYDNQPFLNGFLDRGLLAGPLGGTRFALMWANHQWDELYPAAHPGPAALLPAPNTRYHAERAFEHVAGRYLAHPSYLRIDGAAYLSIYDLPGFVRGLGSVAETAALLDGWRDRAQRDGVGELHLNAVVNPLVTDPATLLPACGFDSATHYTWWHHPGAPATCPTTPYRGVADHARQVWAAMSARLPCRYFPNVTVGWDPSPRTLPWAMDAERGYPYTTIYADASPAIYQHALEDALAVAARVDGQGVVTVNAWNEWSEGSYLEPDQRNGYAYLEATAAAVKARL